MLLRGLCLACAALLCLPAGSGFYLPGVAPQDYARVGVPTPAQAQTPAQQSAGPAGHQRG